MTFYPRVKHESFNETIPRLSARCRLTKIKCPARHPVLWLLTCKPSVSRTTVTQVQLYLHEEILMVNWFIEYNHLIDFPVTPQSDQTENSNIFAPSFLRLYCTEIFTRNQTKIYRFVKYVCFSLARTNYLRSLFCTVEHWDDYFLTLKSFNRFNFN